MGTNVNELYAAQSRTLKMAMSEHQGHLANRTKKVSAIVEGKALKASQGAKQIAFIADTLAIAKSELQTSANTINALQEGDISSLLSSLNELAVESDDSARKSEQESISTIFQNITEQIANLKRSDGSLILQPSAKNALPSDPNGGTINIGVSLNARSMTASPARLAILDRIQSDIAGLASDTSKNNYALSFFAQYNTFAKLEAAIGDGSSDIIADLNDSGVEKILVPALNTNEGKKALADSVMLRDMGIDSSNLINVDLNTVLATYGKRPAALTTNATSTKMNGAIGANTNLINLIQSTNVNVGAKKKYETLLGGNHTQAHVTSYMKGLFAELSTSVCFDSPEFANYGSKIKAEFATLANTYNAPNMPSAGSYTTVANAGIVVANQLHNLVVETLEKAGPAHIKLLIGLHGVNTPVYAPTIADDTAIALTINSRTGWKSSVESVLTKYNSSFTKDEQVYLRSSAASDDNTGFNAMYDGFITKFRSGLQPSLLQQALQGQELNQVSVDFSNKEDVTRYKSLVTNFAENISYVMRQFETQRDTINIREQVLQSEQEQYNKYYEATKKTNSVEFQQAIQVLQEFKAMLMRILDNINIDINNKEQEDSKLSRAMSVMGG